MTIDERLERLAERHEALAQTVELQAGRMDQLMEISSRVLKVAESTVQIARSHEKRIQRLEDGGK